MSIRISELPQTNEITDDDLLAVVDNNIDTTMKIEAKTIKDYNNKELIEELDNTNTKLDDEVTRIDEELATKQPTLVAGDNIEIDEENVISTPSYVAGNNIKIDGKIISAEYLAYDDTEIKKELQEMDDKINNFKPYDDTEIKSDISALQNDKVDKVEGKDLSSNDYTNEEKTKLESLENYDDSNIQNDIASIQDDISDLQNNKANVSDIPDVSNFITSSVDNLVNYYKKNETYTQSEVNNLIGAIQQFHYEIVQTLPQTGETNILYLVPKSASETQNVYDEYVYANSGFEKIGDTQIDLSDYITTTMLNNALANYTTTTDLTTLLNGKVDKVEGKGLSTNDFTNELKTKLEGLENYDDSGIISDLENKVDKIEGKGLSTNDLTNELLASLQSGTTIKLGITNTLNLYEYNEGTYEITSGDELNHTIYFNKSANITIGNTSKIITKIIQNPNSVWKHIIAYATYCTDVKNIKYPYGAWKNNDTEGLIFRFVTTSNGDASYANNYVFSTHHPACNVPLSTNVRLNNYYELAVVPPTTPTVNTDLIGKTYFDNQQALKQDTIQYSTMPTADSTTVGKVVQYIGTTDDTYTNGYFYIGTSDGEETPTYSWEQINVQDSTSGGASKLEDLENVFEIANASLNIETQGAYTTTDYNEIAQRMLNYLVDNDYDTNFYILFSNIKLSSNEYVYDTLLLKPFKILQNTNSIEINIRYSPTMRMYNKLWVGDTNSSYIRFIIGYTNSTDKIVTSILLRYNNANSTEFIATAYNQTISGKKTFSTLPESSVTPTTDNQLTNKSYVDTAISNAITTTLESGEF